MRCAFSSLRQHAAVYLQHLAGDVGRIIRRQEGGGFGYVLGAAAQHAAGARQAPDESARQAFLDHLATQLTDNDTDPLVRESAAFLRDHDDRAQFLAGVNLFLAGVRASLLASLRKD